MYFGMADELNRTVFVSVDGKSFTLRSLHTILQGPHSNGPSIKSIYCLADLCKTLLNDGNLLLTGWASSDVGTQGFPNDADVKRAMNSPTMDEAFTSTSFGSNLRASASGKSDAHIGMLTSGSTGIPRMVRHRIRDLARGVRISAVQAEAVWGITYPMHHIAGVQVMLQALANGCPIVELYGLSGSRLEGAMRKHRVTHLSATPTFYRMLLADGAIFEKIRSVTLGGEPADDGLINRLRTVFPEARFHNIFAATEFGTLLISESAVFSPPADLHNKIRIQENRIWVHRSILGKVVTLPRSGEMELEKRSGAAVPRVNNELGNTDKDASRSTNNPPPYTLSADAGAWYDTGDLVEIVSSDPLRFRIVGRASEELNVAGQRVNIRQVEQVLNEFPGVRYARVLGKPNSVIGNVLTAEIEWIRPEEEDELAKMLDRRVNGVLEVSEAEIRDWLSKRLPPYKIPRFIRSVEKLERTENGKIKRS